MTKRSDFAVFATIAIGAVLTFAAPAAADPSDPPNTSFLVIGHVEAISIQPGADPMRGGRMSVSNLDIVLPANLLITMPGRYMTLDDLYHGPTADGAIKPETGLALSETTPPKIPFEAEVIGNIVNGEYIAGSVRLSQGALHTGAGVIQSIDPATGEMRIGAAGGQGGARVILNDPKGVYGLANSAGPKSAIGLDARFAVDEENAPVHAKTGFPVCVPSTGAEMRCPVTNRPTDVKRFTCTQGGAPAELSAPARDCDPHLPVPLQTGDYVTYFGVLQPIPGANPAAYRIAAYALDAELGVYTSPGADPVYVMIEEAIQGTKGEEFNSSPQEETTRFRVVGFTTDPSRNVEVRLVDSDRTDPATDPNDDPINRLRGVSISGPGGLTPANGPQLGRVRNTWPSKDDARAVRRDAQLLVVGSSHVPLTKGLPAEARGLTSGVYTAPIGEFIYPEPTTFGVNGRPIPVPFENFCFLFNGGGSFETVTNVRAVAKLSPFPSSGHNLSQLVGSGPSRACDNQ